MLRLLTAIHPYSSFGSLLDQGHTGLLTSMTSEHRVVEGVGKAACDDVDRILRKSDFASGDVSRIETWFIPEEDVMGTVLYSKLVAKQPVLYVASACFGPPEQRTLSGVVFDRCGVPRGMWEDASQKLDGDSSGHVLVHTRERNVDGVLQPQILGDEWRCELFTHT